MTKGTINRLREHGLRLAQVSAHNAADFCIYYEGAVVCIEGEHPVYPPISAINGGPPFHPNCVHVLTPFVERLATEREKDAGRLPADVLNKTPAELQRRFRREFPERARREGIRIGRAARQRKLVRAESRVTGAIPPPKGGLREALDREERRIRFEGEREHGAIIAPDGTLLHRVVGTRWTLPLTPEQAADLPGAIITHNHVNIVPPLWDDIAMAAKLRLRELRAVDTRYRYSVRPAGDAWPEDVGVRFQEAFNRHLIDVTMEQGIAQRRGIISRREAIRQRYHEAWLRTAEDVGLVYRRVRWRGR